MSDPSEPSYCAEDVKRAGEIIASQLAWTAETEPHIREAFRIANHWRDGHAFPMRSIKSAVIYQMTEMGVKGIPAARVKRMQAIRKKLRRGNVGLHKIQDLGGCRFILDSMSDVRNLVARVRQTTRHDVRNESDYIDRPKPDGYRCHHLMFTYRDDGVFDGKRIELQFRTRLQHSWATAVEAVSLFRSQDLKSKDGLFDANDPVSRQANEDWLRLFALLSAEFAEVEGCPLPVGTLDKYERIQEIKELAKKVSALTLLDSIRFGVSGTDRPYERGYEPTHFLIRYDHETHAVHITPHRASAVASAQYDTVEALDYRAERGKETVVLVEVDKVTNLRDAYPNYFGDVSFFRDQLRAITLGHSVVEYSQVPRQPPPRAPGPFGDLSWLRQNRFRKPHR